MIDDLDRSLSKLLQLEIPGLNENNIHFVVPDDAFPQIRPAVGLFLYDVRENRDLRDNEWLVERTPDLVKRRPPPARVDCSYLITAWYGADDDPKNVIGEHQLLSQVIRALLRYPTLPQEVLQGSLAGQELPLPAAVLQPGRLQSMGEFWQALGRKPKAALNYTVTISVDVHEPVEIGPPVRDKMLKFKLGAEEPVL